jgi:hypothetical protein
MNNCLDATHKSIFLRKLKRTFDTCKSRGIQPARKQTLGRHLVDTEVNVINVIENLSEVKVIEMLHRTVQMHDNSSLRVHLT